MAIFLTKKHLPSFNHSSFHLNNNSCTGHQLNHSHIILQTGLSDCGTIIRSFNGSYIFSNLVHGYLKNPVKNCSSTNMTTAFAVQNNMTTTFAVECIQLSAEAVTNKTSLDSALNLHNVENKEVYVKAESILPTMSPLGYEEGK